MGPGLRGVDRIGGGGTVIVGMIWLNESVTVLKLVSIVLVLAGVVGLQLSGGAL